MDALLGTQAFTRGCVRGIHPLLSFLISLFTDSFGIKKCDERCLTQLAEDSELASYTSLGEKCCGDYRGSLNLLVRSHQYSEVSKSGCRRSLITESGNPESGNGAGQGLTEPGDPGHGDDEAEDKSFISNYHRK